MEPFTTKSSENQHDHQPLIVSGEEGKEMNNSSKPSNGVASEALVLIEQDQGLKVDREKQMIHGKKLVSSRVVIPERWGQEGLLKDWIDGSTFDAMLAPPKEAALAREALVAQARSPHPHLKLGF
ncbi:hypothetical protein ACS0TY_020179 [Phlomoides rotata]